MPPKGTVAQYLGDWNTCLLGYASAEEIRAGAASGGAVSSLLIYLLQQGVIQGAVVSRLDISKSAIGARPYLAKTATEILDARSSIYMDFPWMGQVRSLLNASESAVAVVGLPCQISRLRRLERRDPDLARRVKLHVALVCGRVPSKALLLTVLARKGIEEDEVQSLRFREGHWRGQMHVWLKDGSEVKFPFGHFSVYRNLHFFCDKRCLHCDDPLGEAADVVCGDVWLHTMKERPTKHSLVISRSAEVTRWIRGMEAVGAFICETIPPERAFQAQRRTLIPAKRGKQARATLGPLFGYRIKRNGGMDSRWNDYIASALILLNYRCSESKVLAPLIFRVPLALLRVYLAVLALLKDF